MIKAGIDLGTHTGRLIIAEVQDNKIIKMGPAGNHVDFKMNRKCAAGTGAFLEEIARRMEVPIGEMNTLAMKSNKVVEIGSFCTVFSATELSSAMPWPIVARRVIRAAALDATRSITPAQGPPPSSRRGAFRSAHPRLPSTS